ncbi:diguanylate cyclase (GGDEF)-like protein/PAS domain S-box-containing protein [Oxalobacteraceae bacterium GrIS 1.11]
MTALSVELRRAQAQLRDLERYLQLGSWELLPSGQFLFWSAQAAHVAGLMPASFDDFLALVPAGERAALALACDRALGGAALDLEHRLLRPDGSLREVHTRARFDAGRQCLLGSLHDITPDKQAAALISRRLERLSATLESITDGFFTLDRDWHFTYLNRAAERLLQRSRQELLGAMVWDEFKEAIGGPSYLEYQRALRDNCPVAFEEYYAPLGRWLDVRAYPSEEGLAVHFRDISEGKRAALALTRSNRALQLLSRCNQVLMRVGQEAELIERICRVAIEAGGYGMAWVGYARDDGSISLEAHAGNAAGAAYLKTLGLSWSEHDPAGRTPAGRTIRSGVPQVCVDITADASLAPFLDPACPYRGAVYLPLAHQGRPFGLLCLYSAEALTETEEEISLLQELADNLAFGISNIRVREERGRIEAAVLKVAASVSASGGDSFFEQLARNMAEAVGAEAAVVARLLPTEPASVRTVSAVLRGQRIDNFEYALADSPCASALRNRYCLVPDARQRPFSLPSTALAGFQAYGGWRLDSADGEPLGLLFVLFREPLKHADFISTTLQIFAARAAGELERQDADARIRAQASVLDKAQDAIVVRDLDDRILFWNKSAERLYGWSRGEALGRPLDTLLGDDPAALRAAAARVLQCGDWSGEITRRDKAGKTLTVEARWTLVNHDDGRPKTILSIETDVSGRKEAEREIRHLAFYDALTGLPNRLLMLDRLQHALAVTGRGGRAGALLYIDLDNFKTLNETLGHDKGDLLLRQVGARLRETVDQGDTVARFGGDEFLVMLENLSEEPGLAAARTEAVGETILAALKRPFLLDGYEHYSTSSIGATLFDGQHSNVGELLKRADLAMYQAKGAGRNTLRFFDPDMQTAVLQRAALEADLRRALQLLEFDLHYQPQLDSAGRVTGAEALVRWNHPQRGMVSPAAFIPLAEESGLILPLGHWVLETACVQLARWAGRAGTGHLSVAVNVSARQLRQPGFAAEVLAVLAETGAAPEKLKLELTESLLVDDIDNTIAKMGALKAAGVGFSLDDFGTGYSSLAYLKRLPLDQLKIDQSFVRDVLNDPNDAAIVRTIVALGQSFGLAVIAEGVETEPQRAFLEENGCHAYQGYLFSRPLAAEQFEAFMMTRS